MYLKNGKRTQSIIAMFLTAGAVLSMGFLAFAGVYSVPFLASVALPLAILAFFLSGFVEWKVFGKSIYKGLSRLKLVGNKAGNYLLAIELNFYLDRYLEVLKNQGQDINNTSTCGFLKDYYRQRENYRRTRSEEDKKKLDELREFFFAQALKKPGTATKDGYIDACLAEHAQSMLITAKRGVWFLRFFLVISAVIGVGAAVVTAYAMSSAIVVFVALSTTALLATVWPIAIIAGIGATFLFYYAMTDIVKHDVLEKGFRSLRQLFKRETMGDQEERLPSYIFRLVVLTLLMAGIIALTVFATVATAGTWWFAMKKVSIDLLPRVPVLVGVIARTIIVPINWVTDIVYGLSTTLQTIVKLKGLLTPIRYGQQLYVKIKKALYALKEKESWGQLLNPFRIVTKLIMVSFEWLIFLGHVVSIGLTTDRLGSLNPVMVAVVCTIPEALQDANFLLKEEKAHESTGSVETEKVATVIESDGHDHDHGSFLIICLKVILFPLILFSATWHWGFRKKDSDLTLKDSIKQSFGIHEHEAEEQAVQQPLPLSAAWKETHRPNFFLEKAIERMDSAKLDQFSASTKREELYSLIGKREKIVKFVKQKAVVGETIGNAVETYLKMPKEEKTEANGDASNGLLNGYANGHANAYSKLSEKIETNTSIKPSSFDVLNKPRTLVQNCCLFRKEKRTTTVKMVEQAFSLMAGG
jgi:hypothetical protein